MSGVIGGSLFFIFGFLSIIMFILFVIGMISPKVFVPQPPYSRSKIIKFEVMSVAFFILAFVALYSAGSSTTDNDLASKDAESTSLKVTNTNDNTATESTQSDALIEEEVADPPKESSTNEVKRVEDTEKVVFELGETANFRDVLVTYNSAVESEGTQYNKPADGYVFIICDFTIENNSTTDITVSSMLSFEAYCDDYSINQTFPGTLLDDANKTLDGSVAEGKKMNGAIAYEVPVDWKKLEIIYSPNFWSSKSITFVAYK
ncbi:MAG: hypothetical protein CVU95_00760 [Firmicutes bacterium HGW-Firmicutes-2]|jgi:hypothetical protein|nr:MAG: hypothetical protein CVU95_00760 [Firmicutes bacterium HGW-Firmicutes-2]